MATEPDYYEILQVSPKAGPEVIDAAYRRLARRYHPDVNPSEAADQRMRELNQALEILTDPQKRADYDRRRQRSSPRGRWLRSQPHSPSRRGRKAML